VTAARAVEAKGGDAVMRLLPLLVVFAVLAASIGYALA
jgi:hypothetical protein